MSKKILLRIVLIIKGILQDLIHTRQKELSDLISSYKQSCKLKCMRLLLT